jgi:hypothetical protein
LRCVSKVLEERDFRTVRPDQITKLVQETGALWSAPPGWPANTSRARKPASTRYPDTQYRRALCAIPDFILEREN